MLFTMKVECFDQLPSNRLCMAARIARISGLRGTVRKAPTAVTLFTWRPHTELYAPPASGAKSRIAMWSVSK